MEKMIDSETIANVTRIVREFPTGETVYETAQIQTLLNIIARQDKEIKHCQKYLNRMVAWKNKFWLSVKPVDKCLFSRRNGLEGLRFFGYSVRLRVLGKEII